ncbi:MAG: hypothetical protein OEM32_10375, partial [Acidimicrobiia bacterium]|nr:hypothetical protein [Acidimicrobiia bacterium]
MRVSGPGRARFDSLRGFCGPTREHAGAADPEPTGAEIEGLRELGIDRHFVMVFGKHGARLQPECG